MPLKDDYHILISATAEYGRYPVTHVAQDDLPFQRQFFSLKAFVSNLITAMHQAADHSIDVTHEELITAMGNSELIIGMLYTITDFATRYVINPFAGDDEFYVSAPEQLIVKATGVNTISEFAVSKTWKQDLIFYEPVDTSINGGDKGRILRRIDSRKNIDAYTDWRTILYRLYKYNGDYLAINPEFGGDTGDYIERLLFGATDPQEYSDIEIAEPHLETEFGIIGDSRYKLYCGYISAPSVRRLSIYRGKTGELSVGITGTSPNVQYLGFFQLGSVVGIYDAEFYLDRTYSGFNILCADVIRTVKMSGVFNEFMYWKPTRFENAEYLNNIAANDENNIKSMVNARIVDSFINSKTYSGHQEQVSDFDIVDSVILNSRINLVGGVIGSEVINTRTFLGEGANSLVSGFACTNSTLKNVVYGTTRAGVLAANSLIVDASRLTKVLWKTRGTITVTGSVLNDIQYDVDQQHQVTIIDSRVTKFMVIGSGGEKILGIENSTIEEGYNSNTGDRIINSHIGMGFANNFFAIIENSHIPINATGNNIAGVNFVNNRFEGTFIDNELMHADVVGCRSSHRFEVNNNSDAVGGGAITDCVFSDDFLENTIKTPLEKCKFYIPIVGQVFDVVGGYTNKICTQEFSTFEELLDLDADTVIVGTELNLPLLKTQYVGIWRLTNETTRAFEIINNWAGSMRKRFITDSASADVGILTKAKAAAVANEIVSTVAAFTIILPRNDSVDIVDYDLGGAGVKYTLYINNYE